MFGFSLGHGSHHDSCEEDDRPVLINGIESSASSRHVSPWTSGAVSPSSSPGTSVAHCDYGFPQVGHGADKKRISWLTSLPASHWTSHRASTHGDASSPPAVSPRGGKKLHLRSSSSSSNVVRPNFGPRAAPAEEAKAKTASTSLVPNAHFLGFMLLMILLISSPLIKILSVVLFVAVLVVNPD
uniref:Uncharacterized protein n=2 Tax=Kalmanozyma brasiliensis (strain GHG001) TaxID=1365824 RepID=V5ERX4_KALBG